MEESQRIHADILLTKAYLNQITADEKLELDILVAQYPEVQQMQAEYAAQIASGNMPAVPELLDTDLPYEGFKERQYQIRMRRNRQKQVWLSAACVLLIIGTALFFLFRGNKQSDNTLVAARLSINEHVELKLANGQTVVLGNAKPVSMHTDAAQLNDSSSTLQFDTHAGANDKMNELKVPPKLDYSLRLADGSTVRLNAATTLKFPFAFTGNTREVYIEGEAYFDIKKDEHRPFIVHTAQADIQVLGTSFNINTYKKGTLKTSLVKGSVAIQKDGERTLLHPGMEAVTTSNLATIQQDFDNEVTLSWMDGIFYFHNTSMEEIANMIPRWFNVPTVIDNQELAKMTFTGNLNKRKSLDVFLTVMQNTSDVRYYFKDNVLHFAQVQ